MMQQEKASTYLSPSYYAMQESSLLGDDEVKSLT